MLDYILKIENPIDWQEIIIKPGWTSLRNKSEIQGRINCFSSLGLRDMVQRFAIAKGERLDPIEPFASGIIEIHHLRWVAIIPPIAIEPEIIFRRQIAAQSVLFKGYSTIEGQLKEVFSRRKHLLIAAPSGFGKTTLLKKILYDFFPDQRLVILDTFQEWNSELPHWSVIRETPGMLDGRGRLGMRALFAMALRMSADRFVLGEIRDREKDIFRDLCLVGHGSVLSTIHASTIAELRQRIGAIEDCFAIFLEKNFELQPYMHQL